MTLGEFSSKKLEESEMNDGMTGLFLAAAEDCILVRGSW